jgi:multisubunit Na+/H+ antiporter MnhG subunit
MKQNTNKYQYSQLERYKESLELAHLKTKTLIVNAIVFVFAVVVLYFLIETNVGTTMILSTMTMFVVLFIINFAYYSYDDDHYNNLKIAMYINTLGVYIITIALILRFQTPSIFTSLFIAYAVSAIYQDFKAMMLSNFSLFVSGSILILRYPDIFKLTGNSDSQTFYILVFLIVFVLLLSLSSYILIKRKTFFYNQLAQIKESEVRNMDLLLEIEKIHTKTDLDSEEYYSSLSKFSDELSTKIGISNIFDRKISILRDSNVLSMQEILEKYPEYNQKEITELMNLELKINNKMRKVGIKASQSQGIEVSRKEIFSESQFKSFSHQGDNNYIMIIAFVTFYTLLKIDKPYMNELEEEKIRDILYNSEYFHRIDRNIINIYLDNNEVFDTIVKDYLEGK